MIRLTFALVMGVLLCASTVQAFEVDDSTNAQMMAIKAKSLVGNQPTTRPPGNQSHEVRARRGGPAVAHQSEAGCGGIAIGNVRPVVGDHRKHETTVVVQGHIYNTGNRC